MFLISTGPTKLERQVFATFVHYWLLLVFSASHITEGESVSHSVVSNYFANLPGFSVHGILQARILEWVAISFSRESSRPRDQTWISHIVGRHFTVWATREDYLLISNIPRNQCSWPALWYTINQQTNDGFKGERWEQSALGEEGIRSFFLHCGSHPPRWPQWGMHLLISISSCNPFL